MEKNVNEERSVFLVASRFGFFLWRWLCWLWWYAVMSNIIICSFFKFIDLIVLVRRNLYVFRIFNNLYFLLWLSSHNAPFLLIFCSFFSTLVVFYNFKCMVERIFFKLNCTTVNSSQSMNCFFKVWYCLVTMTTQLKLYSRKEGTAPF